jgi:hypothetical protein
MEFGRALPGSGYQREKLIFNLQEFVQHAVVPNALYLTVYQEVPISLLCLDASPDEYEDIKLAIQAKRTRFISNFYPMPTYPILQLVLAIFDQPNNPFKIESVKDITMGAVRGFITGLCEGGHFNLFVYDKSGEDFFFDIQLAIKEQDRQQLIENLNGAATAYLGLSDSKRDFKKAYQQFISEHNLFELQIQLDP